MEKGKAYYLPEWLQTKEQQMTFLEDTQKLKSTTDWGPFAYDVDTQDIHTYLFDVFLPYMAEHGYVLRTVRIKEENRREYYASGKYLPDFLQDFHDQKLLFKRLAVLREQQIVGWIKAQNFTCDLFLFQAMNQYGFKLQRDLRKQENRKSLDADLYQFDAAQRELMNKAHEYYENHRKNQKEESPQ